MPYVTGAAILTHVGVAAPSAEDETWADVCAAAVEAAIAERLDGDTPSAGFTSELEYSALVDGAAAYQGRDAPHGVLSIGPDGEVVRLGADILRATLPVIRRHTIPGIG